MSMSLYNHIPKIRFADVRAGLGAAHQELEGARPGTEHYGGGARWAPFALGALVLYLFVSVARMWGPTGLAVVLPVVLFGLTRAIYRATALTLY